MIDAHAHLNFKAFETDWREVADRAVLAGVEKMIVVGTTLESSKRAIELAQAHPALFAAVGIHPHHVQQVSLTHAKAELTHLLNHLRTLITQPKVVAVGEIGLDRHIYKQTRYETLTETKQLAYYDLQKELFAEALVLAREFHKPVIIHSWEAKQDALEMLPADINGVFHCFEGSKKYLKKILEAGLYVSFTGQITYVPDRLAVASEVPLDRLLLETDSPLIAPVPYRGERNEPAYVRLIAEAHASSRGMRVKELDEATTANASHLFHLT